jgi:hypothetical protein
LSLFVSVNIQSFPALVQERLDQAAIALVD